MAMICASLLICLPYPNRKSHGTPASITKSDSFRANVLLCLKILICLLDNNPRAIPDTKTGISIKANCFDIFSMFKTLIIV